jgi:hypothetical protein
MICAVQCFRVVSSPHRDVNPPLHVSLTQDSQTCSAARSEKSFTAQDLLDCQLTLESERLLLNIGRVYVERPCLRILSVLSAIYVLFVETPLIRETTGVPFREITEVGLHRNVCKQDISSRLRHGYAASDHACSLF